MGKRLEAPITGRVLAWAIADSGYPREAIASRTKVTPEELQAWEEGTSLPSWPQVQLVAGVLKRPVALFFMPAPPEVEALRLEFRASPGSSRAAPSPEERRAFREAARLQKVLGWLRDELGDRAEIPTASVEEDPEIAGVRIRAWTGISDAAQESWRSGSKAFRAWRVALEKQNVHVLALSLGDKGIRGFSLWSQTAPLLCVNTKWNHHARIYTLFHEIAHLCTGHSSACLGYPDQRAISKQEFVERWCERVAAAALLPRTRFLEKADLYFDADAQTDAQLEAVKRLANHFSVSWRATCLRLIELRRASWQLYDAIPSSSDAKEEGGFGGKGRQREQLREDQLGALARKTLERGVRAELITKADALTYYPIEADGFASQPVTE